MADDTKTSSKPDDADDNSKVRRSVENASENEQKKALEKLLEKHQGNIARTAREAGLAREYLHRLLKRHGLVDQARELRTRAQGRSRGRPRSAGKTAKV